MFSQLTRRQFIGTSFVLTCFPKSLFADSRNDVIMRMAVMSDVHFSENPNSDEVKRLVEALNFMYKYSSDLPYPKFDALLVAGDMTNHGLPNELNLFKKILHEGIKPETQTILCMGNHEFIKGNKSLWTKTFDLKANDRYNVNGYTVLTLSPEFGKNPDGDYLYALQWLEKELQTATKADPKKPIFLIQHYHITGTVYGSLNGDCWGSKDLISLLQKYPQVIDFSGHSHYPVNDPRSAWQGVFSAFGTGTLSYFEMAGEPYSKFPKGYHNAAQFYVVEVHRDHSIVLKPYDLITGSFFDVVYVVSAPGNAEKYLYTDKRYQTATSPKWKKDTRITCSDETCYGATFRFPQAVDDTVVSAYIFQFESKVGNSWEKFLTKYVWSEYYFNNMPKTMEVVIDELEPLTEYRLQVTAINPFNKKSEEKLQINFKTLKDNEKAIDKTAVRPQANMIDVAFHDGKIINAPTSSTQAAKSIQKVGNPQVFVESSLGASVASFDGKSDFYKIPFSAREYSRLRRSITMAACFKVDDFSQKGGSVIFGNTEKGGYSIEVNHSKKVIEFWIHIEGKYVIVSCPIQTGKYYTVYGVYDGTRVILYLDGKKVAEQKAHGLITYPLNERTHAFCIGCDIATFGNGQSFFKGKIAFARFYSWNLNEEQIANLSK